MSEYRSFLDAKAATVPAVGFEAKLESDMLYPFQVDIVRWACRRGRAAIFADCGMGKTAMQLEWAREVCDHAGGDVLILAPLAVATQTVREASKFGVKAEYHRSQPPPGRGIVVTNYEMLEHFDADSFAGVVLDESSILKAYDGKTRTAIIEAFRQTPFRLACTATPAPNDFMELGNHAEFLGVMTRPEMLSMYFVHDGGSTQDWRLKGHAERAFWRWVCSWAVMIRKPSDLGYDDGDFILPPLDMHEHVVGVDHQKQRKDGLLFALEAHTLEERRGARKASIDDRVAKCSELIASSSGSWIVWCALNAEGDALERSIAGSVQVSGSDTPELKEKSMIDFAEGRIRVLISKPSICGFGLNFQVCSNVAFVGLSDSYEQFYQAIRRCWRFGQKRSVACHVIVSELEGAVASNIERKERESERMAAEMVAHMSDFIRASVRGTSRDVTEYRAEVPMVIPSWIRTEAA